MKYDIQLKPRAVKDLQKMPPDISQRILAKIEAMENDLQGDIKKLTNFAPEYRLRVDNYRVLFEVNQQTIMIYRVKHRSQTY